jgi:transcriptional regulator with XRE-family HTH domain
MEKTYADLGYLIKKRRRAIGFTQEQLAEKAGVSQNYIAKIETGIAKVGPKTLAILALILDITNQELIDFNLGFFEDIAKLIDKRIDYDNAFLELPTRVKEFLLKLVPIVQKYI